MPVHIDLRALAEKTAPERAFISLYLSDEGSLERLEPRIRTGRKLLVGDERTHFDENIKLIRGFFEREPARRGCLFVCWALDELEFHPLDVPTPELLWIDSSPYIRPLAELQDEYEDFAVVVADNTSASVYLVSSLSAEDEASIEGGIKNNVKVGGWSQQRYKRRRDNQLKAYAGEIAGSLLSLSKERSFRRVLMVGSRETLAEIKRALPLELQRLVMGERAIDLSKGDAWIRREVFELFQESERASERSLWEEIKDAYFRGGRAAVHLWDVFEMARQGAVEAMVVVRDLETPGVRCRDCEHLGMGQPPSCRECGSSAMFEVDLINELVELLALSGGSVDFVDAIPELVALGGVGALLRYG